LRIPLLKPKYFPEITEEIEAVLKSGWWGMGSMVELFEDEFVKFLNNRGHNIKYAVAVNSGTAALHLALKERAAGRSVEHGNIVVPAFTFASTAMVGLYEGYDIRFADINPKTYCMDLEHAQSLIDENTVAVIPVNFAGRTYHCDEKYRSFIIEDCAHSLDIASKVSQYQAWSFHAVKPIPCGDGGMITIKNNDVAYERLKKLRWLGIDKDTHARENRGYNWEYDIGMVGFKYHMNDLTAAIGLVQLKHANETSAGRAVIANRYDQAFGDDEEIKLPPLSRSWHLYVIQMLHGDRDEFIEHMRSNGISVGVHYKPLNHYSIFPDADLPHTEAAYKRIVSLPIYAGLQESEQEFIIQKTREWLKRSS